MIPAALHQRLEALRQDPTLLAQLRSDAEAAVVQEVFASDHAEWLPDHPLIPPPVRIPFERYPDEAAALAASVRIGGPVRRIGLDVGGNPRVISDVGSVPIEPYDPEELAMYGIAEPGPVDDHTLILGRTAGGALEIVQPFGELEPVNAVQWRHLDAQGRLIRAEIAGDPERGGPAKGGFLITFVWDGDHCEEATRRSLDGYIGGWRGSRFEGQYDFDGLAAVIEHAANWTDTIEELEADLVAPAWSKQVWERLFDAAEPEPLPADEAEAIVVAGLASTLERALAEASAADGPHVGYITFNHADRAVPRAGVLDQSDLRDSSGRSVAADERIGVVSFDLDRDRMVDQLYEMDDAELRAWRSWRQHRLAFGGSFEALALPLQRALDALPAAQTTLLFVSTGRPDASALRYIRETLGQDHIDRLLAGATSAAEYPVPPRRPRTLDELETALAAWNVPTEDLFIFDTCMGGALVPTGGAAVTRLGGLADLPVGTNWPTVEGRELTHVCSIDLAEVPREVGALLPREGVLSVFIDFDESDDAFWEGSPQDDPRAQIVWVEPGAPTHRPAPVNAPRDSYYPPALLPELPMRVEPYPCLPRGQDAGAELEPDEEERLDAFLEACREIDPDVWEMQHVLLGTPWSHQDVLPEDGEIPLLHIASDDRIGFCVADVGDITIYITHDALLRRAWDETRFSINF